MRYNKGEIIESIFLGALVVITVAFLILYAAGIFK